MKKTLSTLTIVLLASTAMAADKTDTEVQYLLGYVERKIWFWANYTPPSTTRMLP